MVSAVIVVILASGTLFAISATKKSSAEERHRATAHGIAQEDQARMRGFRISALSNYNAGHARFRGTTAATPSPREPNS